MKAIPATLVVVVIQLAGSISKGQIVFLQEPKNVTVAERMDAFFACTYRGTSGVPTWKIADNTFVTNALPPKHSYNGSGLVVNSVDLSLNMTSYACFFSEFIGGGQFSDITSNTGFLIIAANASSINSHLKPPSSSAAYLEPTIHTQTTSAANVEPTITISIVEQQFNTFEQTLDGVQPIATESATPLTLTHLSLRLVIAGVATGIGISLVVTATFIMFVCAVTQRRSRALKTRGNDVLSDNRKEMDMDVKENVAYQVPPSRIKMMENEAYAVLPNRSL